MESVEAQCAYLDNLPDDFFTRHKEPEPSPPKGRTKGRYKTEVHQVYIGCMGFIPCFCRANYRMAIPALHLAISVIDSMGSIVFPIVLHRERKRFSVNLGGRFLSKSFITISASYVEVLKINRDNYKIINFKIKRDILRMIYVKA